MINNHVRSNHMHAIVLAGGFAKRMLPLTKDTPKHLLPVADKPMLQYVLEKLYKIRELRNIYITTNAKFEDIAEISAGGPVMAYTVFGLVDLDAVPEEKSHLPFDEEDNPIPLVRFLETPTHNRRRRTNNSRNRRRSPKKRKRRKR